MAQNEAEEKVSNKKFKKQVKAMTNIIICLAVLLAASVILCIFLTVKSSESKEAGEDYEGLTKKYNELLVENRILSEKLEESKESEEIQVSPVGSDDPDNNYLEQIVELEETIEANGQLFEELYAEGDNPALLSEAYIYAKKDWNLLNNFTLSDSGNTVSSGFIRVNPRYYYCAYAPSGDFSITSYSEDYAILDSFKEDASSGAYVKFSDKSYYIKVSFPAACKNSAILVSTGIDKETMKTPLSKKAFYVVSKNSPVSLSPSEAVSRVNSGGTVLILPGTYTDQISASSKSVNLVGVGSSSCVIQSFSCDYYTPPLEIAAGTVSNLSFKAINNNSAKTELKAYAVHADYDYSYGRNLTISNCVMTSDFNSGIGIGLRGKGTLKLINCTITGADRGIFLHDCDRENVGGNQNFVVDSCTITSTNSNPAIHLHSQAMSNANISLTFTNNTLKSAGSELLVCTNQNGGTFEDSWNNLQNFHLVTGYGNNVSAMNQ